MKFLVCGSVAVVCSLSSATFLDHSLACGQVAQSNDIQSVHMDEAETFEQCVAHCADHAIEAKDWCEKKLQEDPVKDLPQSFCIEVFGNEAERCTSGCTFLPHDTEVDGKS